MQWFRGGLVLKAHRRLYHPALARRKGEKHLRRLGEQKGDCRLAFDARSVTWRRCRPLWSCSVSTLAPTPKRPEPRSYEGPGKNKCFTEMCSGSRGGLVFKARILLYHPTKKIRRERHLRRRGVQNGDFKLDTVAILNKHSPPNPPIC